MLIKSDYNKRKNKGIAFFSASTTGDYQQLWDFGIREILVSYHYIRKNLKYYDEMLPKLKEEGGIFMTDSGAFSFMAAGLVDEMYTEAYWMEYLEEYVAWIKAHKEYIYVVANLDLDVIVGRDVVRKWNKKYFEPLEKEVDVVYVAHEDKNLGDPFALKHFEEYCRKYKYIGINQNNKKYAHHFFIMAKKYNIRIHGFAWTELSILRKYPFFSVDSTSWLSGVRYGTSYKDDGKNFKTFDSKKKYLRKSMKVSLQQKGVDYNGVLGEKRIPINQMNLIGWLGFRREYLKIANLKLTNKVASEYGKKRTS